MTVTQDGEIVTFPQHIIEQQRRHHPRATGQFSWLLSGISLATKIIASSVRRAGLVDVLGETGEENVHGEVVQKLDVIANETLKRTLGYRGNVGIIASEEDNDPRVVQESTHGGDYIVMFDPLDGSSNIDSNVSVGTIFSVLRRPSGEKTVGQSVLQCGRKQLAAGYVVYGPSTVLVYTTGDGVHMFTLEPQIGAYILSRENIRIRDNVDEYSVNEAYVDSFPAGYQQYLGWAKGRANGRTFSSRYIGSLVADFHRILCKGGVFFYPPTASQPSGKLRLMYEANPLAMIAEQAGGAATDSRRPILDLEPETLHQRTPLIIGCRGNVEKVIEFVNGRV